MKPSERLERLMKLQQPDSLPAIDAQCGLEICQAAEEFQRAIDGRVFEIAKRKLFAALRKWGDA